MLPHIPADELSAWIRTRADAAAHRFMIGLAGPPGSGKSTISARLAEELDAVIVPMDGFHLSNEVLDERGLRAVKGAPQTFDVEGFLGAVRDLRSADHDVSLPDFDRVVDEPRPDRIVVPMSSSIVIVEGNYLLLDSGPWTELRQLFDVVAHLDVDPTVRVQRLIDRHVRFGKTSADAAEFVNMSDEANAALVDAASHRAHLVVDIES